MSDLISRQTAIKALGEEPEVWSGKDEYAQGLNNQWHYDVNALKAVSSVQPEIIRCEDCKHSDWYTTVEGKTFCYCMRNGNSGYTHDDFCSRGESEEDEQTD